MILSILIIKILQFYKIMSLKKNLLVLKKLKKYFNSLPKIIQIYWYLLWSYDLSEDK